MGSCLSLRKSLYIYNGVEWKQKRNKWKGICTIQWKISFTKIFHDHMFQVNMGSICIFCLDCFWKYMTINLFRFFHLSEMGDLNYIFGYSIETNPDKAGMCKYECIWLDQVKNDIDINFFIWSSCTAALKLSIHFYLSSESYFQSACVLSQWIQRIWKLFLSRLQTFWDKKEVKSFLHVLIQKKI